MSGVAFKIYLGHLESAVSVILHLHLELLYDSNFSQFVFYCFVIYFVSIYFIPSCLLLFSPRQPWHWETYEQRYFILFLFLRCRVSQTTLLNLLFLFRQRFSCYFSFVFLCYFIIPLSVASHLSFHSSWLLPHPHSTTLTSLLLHFFSLLLKLLLSPSHLFSFPFIFRFLSCFSFLFSISSHSALTLFIYTYISIQLYADICLRTFRYTFTHISHAYTHAFHTYMHSYKYVHIYIYA